MSTEVNLNLGFEVLWGANSITFLMSSGALVSGLLGLLWIVASLDYLKTLGFLGGKLFGLGILSLAGFTSDCIVASLFLISI